MMQAKLPRHEHVAMTVTDKRLAGSKLLTRQRAECGDPRADAHHADYSKPLEVEFLCRRHHAARHRQKIVKRPTDRIT